MEATQAKHVLQSVLLGPGLRSNILAEFQLTQAIVCAHKFKKLYYETFFFFFF
jgi:hypothetical protein